jgi:hypothetical protein
MIKQIKKFFSINKTEKPQQDIHNNAHWFQWKTKVWLVKQLIPLNSSERIFFLCEIYGGKGVDVYFELQREFIELRHK